MAPLSTEAILSIVFGVLTLAVGILDLFMDYGNRSAGTCFSFLCHLIYMLLTYMLRQALFTEMDA